MTDVWLVRHGETDWSKSGQHTSLTDLPLTEEGTRHVGGLAERLAKEHFDLVLTSPLQRARRTAELAGFGDAQVCDDLVEWRYGAGEGLTTPQIQQHVPGWRIWTHGAPKFDASDAPIAGSHERFVGPGESKYAVTARLGGLIERLRDGGHERVLLFGHGHALRAFAALWCELGVEAGAHFPLSTGAVSVLGYEKTTPAIVRWNS